MRNVTVREDKKNAAPATSRKIATAGDIFSRVSGENHCTASKIATTSARQINTGRQNRLTRKTDLLLFIGLAFAFEHITRAAHGFQEGGMICIDFDFFTQPANINVHAARRHEALSSPNRIQQLIARKDTVRARSQIIQQTKLKGR